jgi:hypothetical protein
MTRYIFISFLALIFVSCSKEEVEPTSQYDHYPPPYYDYGGYNCEFVGEFAYFNGTLSDSNGQPINGLTLRHQNGVIQSSSELDNGQYELFSAEGYITGYGSPMVRPDTVLIHVLQNDTIIDSLMFPGDQLIYGDTITVNFEM